MATRSTRKNQSGETASNVTPETPETVTSTEATDKPKRKRSPRKGDNVRADVLYAACKVVLAQHPEDANYQMVSDLLTKQCGLNVPPETIGIRVNAWRKRFETDGTGLNLPKFPGVKRGGGTGRGATDWASIASNVDADPMALLASFKSEG